MHQFLITQPHNNLTLFSQISGPFEMTFVKLLTSMERQRVAGMKFRRFLCGSDDNARAGNTVVDFKTVLEFGTPFGAPKVFSWSVLLPASVPDLRGCLQQQGRWMTHY